MTLTRRQIRGASSKSHAGWKPAFAVSDERVLDVWRQLHDWCRRHDWKGHDPWNALTMPGAGWLTLGNRFMKIALIQLLKRSPINLRGAFGIRPSRSDFAAPFFARAYMDAQELTGRDEFGDLAQEMLDWSLARAIDGYSGPAWGYDFEYQGRVVRLPSGRPMIVLTAFVAQALLDAAERYGRSDYREAAVASAEFISNDLPVHRAGPERIIFSYAPGQINYVYNASLLGACLLARVGTLTGNRQHLDLAEQAVNAVVAAQLPAGGWHYGAELICRWQDNYHTAYVLESLLSYMKTTGRWQFMDVLRKGIGHYERHFFTAEGAPRMKLSSTWPIDIQCCAQAIQTCSALSCIEPRLSALAGRVAAWTFANMLNDDGSFAYQRTRFKLNRTPMIHWGQATMLRALMELLRSRRSAS